MFKFQFKCLANANKQMLVVKMYVILCIIRYFKYKDFTIDDINARKNIRLREKYLKNYD